MEFEVGDVVLCTVERIERTIIFVEIEGGKQGSIVISEIAPGRIRNLREYVVPKKKIVCKVLRISQRGNIELSLRRVTLKEQKEVKEQYKQERGYKNILKTVLGEKSKEVVEKIIKTERLHDFLQEAKEDSKKLEKIIGKENTKKIIDILKTEKQKKHIIKREFFLTTTKSEGIKLIKNILKEIQGAEVKYISAGKYSIKTEAENVKKADNKIKEILEDIEKQAKKKGAEFK